MEMVMKRQTLLKYNSQSSINIAKYLSNILCRSLHGKFFVYDFFSQLYLGQRNVFVSNIAWNASLQDIKEYFGSIGPIIKVEYVSKNKVVNKSKVC